MFNNIGKKVKALTKVCLWIEIVAFIIAGIILLVSSNRYNNNTLIGILIMFIGPMLAWISSWIIYAIGEAADKDFHEECMEELIEKINVLEDRLSKISESNQVLVHSSNAESNTNEPIIKSN